MMKAILIFICCSLITGLQAQTLERSVFSNSGASGNAAGVSLDYTIGESLAATLTAGNSILTAGFQQGDLYAVSLNENGESLNELQAFPNPCADMLNVYLNIPGKEEVKVLLSDITGRLVFATTLDQLQLNSSVFRISTREFEEGTYLLSVVIDKEHGASSSLTRSVQFVR